MEENLKTEKPRFWRRPVPATILVFILSVLLTLLGQTVGAPIALVTSWLGKPALAFAGEYASMLGVWIVFLLVMGLKKGNRPMFRAMGPEAKGNNWKTSLFWGLICGFGLNMAVAVCAMLHGDISLSFNELSIPWFLILLLCVGIQSGSEELVCRNYLYQNLRRIWPGLPAVAIFGNALLFASLHLFNDGITVLSYLDLVLSGLMFSLMVWYLDSFWAPVIAHTTWNFTQSILLGLPNSGMVSAYSVFKLDQAAAKSSFFYDVNFGIEGSLFSVILEAVFCAIIILAGRKRNRPSLDIWAPKKPAVTASAPVSAAPQQEQQELHD